MSRKNENTLSTANTFTARCLSAFSISLLPLSSLTFAKPQLEEVVVTAQIRAESLQDVPISVATMSGETIDNYAISTLQELTTYIPNVNINQGADTPNLFIRGIGSGTNEGFEQSVGMFVDGVYAGRALQSSVSATTDLARVEILKGPQSILFGKNTIAGAVSITTSKPTDEFEGVAEGLWDPELDEQQYTFILSGPITNSVAGRVAVRHEKSDGWWENVTLDEKGPDNDEWFARGTLRWEPSDRLEILAKYEYGDFSRKGGPSVIYQSDIVGQETLDGAVPIPIVSDRVRGAGDVITSNDIRTDLAALTVNWDLDFATLTSISAYSAYDRDRVQNTDSVAVASINRASKEKFDQFSQEVRLVSPGGDTIDWIAGAYYQTADLDRNEEITDLDFALSGPLSVPPLVFVEDLRGDNNDRIFDQQADSWSVFAQGTWNVAETLSFTAGLRYNEETKDVDKIILPNPALGFRAGGTTLFAIPGSGTLVSDLRSHDFSGLSRDEDSLNYSVNAQWFATADAMLYASVSTGTKGGGFDAAYTGPGETIRLGDPFTGEPTGEVVPGNDPSVLEFEDEKVLAYEIGAKMTLLEGAAEMNLALFRMEYENLQVSSLIGDVFRVGNAGEATSQGVELDTRLAATDQLSIGLSVAYLDATYDDFSGATCTVPQSADPANNPGCLREDGTNIESSGETGGQDLSGDTLTYAPKWSASFNVQYVWLLTESMELVTAADVNYNDSFYSALDLDPNTEHDSSTLVNARIALGSIEGGWTLALIGKNLTDEKTYAWRNDVPLTNSNSYFGTTEPPRSVALQMRYAF